MQFSDTYFFYILKCSDGSFYVGSTTNLEDRVRTHNKGEGATHTAKRRPVQLEYHEKFNSFNDAVKRERQVKKWSRAKKEALICGEKESLKKLSKSHRYKLTSHNHGQSPQTAKFKP